MIASVESVRTSDRVLLAHGGGGELMSRLIREHFLPRLGNERLARLTDGAVLPAILDGVVFTTDSYVVTPLEFPGGDIGRLSVCGTVNDLSVMGAEALSLSLGLIVEEGLCLERLDRIVRSIAEAAREAGVQIVTGDTKVIERRAPSSRGSEPEEAGLFINTAGIGRLRQEARLDVRRCRAGDVVIVSGNIAEHGIAIMSCREGLEFSTPIRSDAAPLNGMISGVLKCGGDVKFLRDATRGGVAGVLADVSEEAKVSIEIEERLVPITPACRQAAEMLGLDPLTVANEGKVVAIVAADDVERVLSAMKRSAYGAAACRIGRLTDARPPLVELVTRVEGRRVVPRPYGEELPRIC